MSHTDGKGNIPKIYSIFHGEVASLQAYGAFVKIPGCKRQGLVHKSQMSSAHIEDPSEMLAKGEMVYCKVIGFEGEGEKISLSMKVINQTTGQDLDPNNVQLDQDAKKRRQWKHIGKNKIELGAELNTTCRRCGGHGHLTIDCFAGKDGTQYELIPDLETLTALPPAAELSDSQHKKKKKKKEKKKKKKKTKKKRQSSSSSATSASEDEEDVRKHTQSKGSHSHRDRSHNSFSKDGVIRRERRASDKQSRSASSSPEHNVRADKIRRGGDTPGPSDESSSSSPSRHGKRQGEDYTRGESRRLHSLARSRDRRPSDQGYARKRLRHSLSSNDSPSPKDRSRRTDGYKSRQDSDNCHDHCWRPEGGGGKSKDRFRGPSDDMEGVQFKQKVSKEDKGSFSELSKTVGKYPQGERFTSRQRDNSSERSDHRISKKGYDNERRHRSRSGSREKKKKNKHRKRSSS